jgi:hypothetical protein
MFELGKVVATPAALKILEDNGIEYSTLIYRHQSLESSELGAQDCQANLDAVKNDGRIFSRYTVNGKKLYLITEWDRSATTILMADEY